MINITDRILDYRECSRHIWNSYFLKINWHETEWDYLDYYNEISDTLLRETVLRQANEGDSISLSPNGFYEKLKVVPNLGPIGYEAMFGITTSNTTEWKQIQLKTVHNDFRFVELFDWTVSQTRDSQYARVRLTRSDEHRELIGCDFLLEVWSVSFFLV